MKDEQYRKILELTCDEVRTEMLLSTSYCTINLPTYFDFTNLLDKLNEEMNGQSYYKKASGTENASYKFFAEKDSNLSYRCLRLIHPVSYISLVNVITKPENWDIIVERFKKFQNNKDIVCCSIPLETKKDSTSQKDTILNWWQKFEQECLRQAISFDYVYITDISDCYPSIYTHSIAWALHDKKDSKKKRGRNDLLGNTIDGYIGDMTYGQTNGIPQGSKLMDFVAEMVLGYADMQLSEEIKKYKTEHQTDAPNLLQHYKVLRYRDDYRLFAETENEARILIQLLNKVLSDLNLHLNSHKTKLSSNPVIDSVKPDKIEWCNHSHLLVHLQNKVKDKDEINIGFQNVLLNIYAFSKLYPNSGALARALDDYSKIVREQQLIHHPLSFDAASALISICVKIGIENERTFPLITGIISLLLKGMTKEQKKKSLYAVQESCSAKPFYELFGLWLQRLTLKSDIKKTTESLLASLVETKDNTIIWNSSWLNNSNKNLVNIIETTSIIDQAKLDAMPEIIDPKEVSSWAY